MTSDGHSKDGMVSNHMEKHVWHASWIQETKRMEWNFTRG